MVGAGDLNARPPAPKTVRRIRRIPSVFNYFDLKDLSVGCGILLSHVEVRGFDHLHFYLHSEF